MLKVGIFGVGHTGKMHARILNELRSDYLVIGFYDPNDSAAAETERELGLLRFTDPDLLIAHCDCILIATPVATHFGIASKAIRKSKHVFIERPVTQTAEEARILLQLAEEAGVQVQIGYAERFNPAFVAARSYIGRPMHNEAQRLVHIGDCSATGSVVNDLMIHDLDIILSIVRSNIRRVSANGVAVISNSPDIVHARIEFDNGCVASLTASRISQFDCRQTRIYQRNASILVDYLEKEAEVAVQRALVLSSGAIAAPFGYTHPSESVAIERPEVQRINAIEQGFSAFAHAVSTGNIPAVSIEDAYRSMELAAQITECLKMAGAGVNDNI
jgi:predicted dehydrogenase